MTEQDLSDDGEELTALAGALHAIYAAARAGTITATDIECICERWDVAYALQSGEDT